MLLGRIGKAVKGRVTRQATRAGERAAANYSMPPAVAMADAMSMPAALGGGQASVIGLASSASGTLRGVRQNAYDVRWAQSKGNMRTGGIIAGGYLGANQIATGNSRTHTNQNTFVTRRMRRQNVGISSGALQTFDQMTRGRSIGGMT